ncbi:MAG TPA: amidase family protein [Candidatus Melainabacteria bacterium]|nr:amidase family protein [Candidatus Melainabacteria bacterium]
MNNDEERKYGMQQSFRVEAEGTVGGTLSGRTFVVKDLFDVKGYKTGAGSERWLEMAKPAADHARAVKLLLQSGAILVGKSQTDEFALSLDGINAHYGTPLNSLYPERIPGGSSSGSAALVAAGLADFGLGSDTVGSIRVPAAYCGLYGFRPSHGVVPLDGVLPLGPSFDTVGWLTKNIDLLRDTARALLPESATSTVYPERVVISAGHFQLVHENFRDELIQIARKVASSLGPVEIIDFDTRVLDSMALTFSIIRSYEAWQYYGLFVEANLTRISKRSLPRLLEGKTVTPAELEMARSNMQAARILIDTIVKPGTILCLPSIWNLPPRLDATEEELDINRRQNIRLTICSVLGGTPQITLPIRLSKDALFSLSFMGHRGEDLGLIEAAIEASRFCT